MSSQPSDHPVLGTATRSAVELAAELRREFERTMLERYGQAPTQDPVLATLFHATAVQLARVYDEAEQVFPEAVFDDLVSGLGMPPRAAQPAQTVVAFTGALLPELVTPAVPLVGINQRGEHLAFAVDVPVRIGPAALRFAAVAEGGRLSTVTGASLPPAHGDSGTPVPLPAGTVPLDERTAPMGPTLFLAFEVGDGHLGGLGLFVDTQSADDPVARALARSAWQLLDGGAGEREGVAREALVLRSRGGPGGVRLLDWQHDALPGPEDVTAAQPAVPAEVGAYGPLCWVWPDVPPARRARSRPPAAIARALPRLLPPGHETVLERPLVWVQVAIPAGTRAVGAAIQRIVAHAVPASNVEAYGERVNLGELGAVVAFRPEGLRTRHLVAVLGVTGEQGGRYVPEADPTAGVARGRYRERTGSLEIRPARGPTGRFDRYVQVRLLYTDGARANGLQPGDVVGRGARLANVGARVSNLVPARGGSAPPAYASAKIRFAELLRTRERVVTGADYDVTARAYEPRVLGATVASVVELGEDRVPVRVEVVTVRVRAADFVDPDAELPRLVATLERHLQARAALGTRVRVAVQVERAGAR